MTGQQSIFFVDDHDYEEPNDNPAWPIWEANPFAYGNTPKNWNLYEVSGEKGNTSAPTVALALK